MLLVRVRFLAVRIMLVRICHQAETFPGVGFRFVELNELDHALPIVKTLICRKSTLSVTGEG
jgi:hypothetical protein